MATGPALPGALPARQRQSGFLIWGTQGRLLYNDACLPRLAQHHPQALGQALAQAWPALWKGARPGQLTP